ncbi:MAG TPA: bifunctional adenosylcobinamide kinase/adenosylcobinamide-phosphate guanylyltransferase [Patescibacteria group bacterium]|nr:bifunctional adenosylcobinamide kinase/adenosylcobinamide-phosphate guanylyltransferase [Patescibacteria group bacterium]
MKAKVILVTGGARSGKSTFAEQLAAQAAGPVAYIATAQVYDEEMRHRVDLHQERRPAHWQTYEAPYHADTVLEEALQGPAQAVLFDCLTLYTTNLLLQLAESVSREQRAAQILAAIDRLLAAARQGTAPVIFVTNEVGMGIVPENPLAREYRDIAGWVNQRAAVAADQVYLVVCGLATEIKKNAVWL